MSRDEFWFWFGVWTSVLMLAGAGTVINFSDWFAPDVAMKIAKGCVAVAAVNNVVLTAAKYRGFMDAKIAASLPNPSTVAKILLAAFVLSMFLPGRWAMAQTHLRPPAMTGNIAADIKTDLANAGIKQVTVQPGAACDFNVFAALDPKNVVTTIQNCVSDANKLFLPDVQAALDSATAYKDTPGIDCLTPALAIVKAAVGTPAVTAPDGSITTPAVQAGVILIFQKFREFTLANGPSACKNWVQSTINGAVAGAL